MAAVPQLWPAARLAARIRPRLIAVARRNVPLAAADAIEWGSRRLDIAILGLFVAPTIVGIYYVAQQVASMPQKLKTSFDPILGPVITQKLAEGDKAAVARAGAPGRLLDHRRAGRRSRWRSAFPARR